MWGFANGKLRKLTGEGYHWRKRFLRSTVGWVLLSRVGSFRSSLSTPWGFTGTYSIKTSDFPPFANEDRLFRGRQIASSAIPTLASSPRDVSTYRLLGSLGSHDLSAMRELLGSPKSCFAATRNQDDSKPFITAMLEYEGFTTIYETGIDSVRVFDASIEVMGDGKRLRLDYDTVRYRSSLLSIVASILSELMCCSLTSRVYR